MDLSKFKQSQLIILGSTLLLTISMFLNWFSLSAFGFSVSTNGFDYSLTGIIPWLISLVMSAKILVGAFAPDVKLPEIPWGTTFLSLGVIAALLVLLQLLVGDDPGSRSIGLYLAFLSGLGLAGGGFLTFQEEKATA
ncbi:MAG TPA: hypothetical protein ENI86_12685 [Acidimicrobiales bacterium]|nr:hypothetical protein [Acidimicrobiales bacterium]